MAVTAIHDCCEAGALAGLISNRNQSTTTPASYATLIGIAKAIADQFIVFNAASGAALADADKVNLPQVVQSVAQGIVEGRSPISIVPADYNDYAGDIYNIAKEAVTAGGLT